MQAKKGLILFFIMVLLLIGYLYLTNFIETKKIYPQENEWFSFGMWDYTDNSSCVEFGNASLSYYNDISESSYNFNQGQYNNLFYVYIPIRKICDFNELWIKFTVTNISFTPKIIDSKSKNISTIEFFDKNDSFRVFIKNKSWDFYELKILIPIKNKFYNYYRIFDGNKLGFETFSFTFKKNIFNGYLADESSFNVIDGKVISDRPIFSNSYKWFKLEGDYSLIRFNPKSKPWFLIQKILDTLILGLISVIIYELPWIKILIFYKKIYKSFKQQIHVNKISNTVTIKNFLSNYSLNLVALSVFLLVAITLSSHDGYLSRPLGVLSAGISYFLLLDLVKRDRGNDNFTLGVMKAFLVLFAIVFCIWVILNLIIPLQSIFDIIIFLIWLLFILGVPIKLYYS